MREQGRLDGLDRSRENETTRTAGAKGNTRRGVLAGIVSVSPIPPLCEWMRGQRLHLPYTSRGVEILTVPGQAWISPCSALLLSSAASWTTAARSSHAKMRVTGMEVREREKYGTRRK